MKKNKWTSSQWGIDASGSVDVTEQVQQLIIDATEAGQTAVLESGIYLVAPLYCPSGSHLHLEKGAVLLGTINEKRIPLVPTRVAGIECQWYPAIVNIEGAHDVLVDGLGEIDGQGPYWWSKYWGADGHGGMRGHYDKKGLRWACDYDCMRVRNMMIMRSQNVKVQGIKLRQSGFWNLHICYSNRVHIEGVHVEDCGHLSPSTDGIDIDSSHDVLIEGCTTSCNDDNICIKSGRDADGLKVGIPCHHIEIRDCNIKSGFGVTIGSEVSGGIHDIAIKNIHFDGADCGFRIKSSVTRKGYIRNIAVEDLEMVNVRYPFHICLNWNPRYSICKLPSTYDGEVSEVWKKLLDTSMLSNENTHVSNIAVRNVQTQYKKDFIGKSRAFNIEGFEDMPIENLRFENIDLTCSEYGVISCVRNLEMDSVRVNASEGHVSENDQYDNR